MPHTERFSQARRKLSALLLGRMLPQQVITEQLVDAAVKHGVGVAYFAIAAVILHQAVRLQRVRADLAAEADGIFAAYSA